MIELISNTIFVISIMVLIYTGFRIGMILFWYEDKTIGLVILLIAIMLGAVMLLSIVILMYALYYLSNLIIPTIPTEYIKFKSAILILIINVIVFFISINTKNKVLDYCLKKGIITKRESILNIFKVN
ncbi:hypothetical protein [Methanococcus sp. CF]